MGNSCLSTVLYALGAAEGSGGEAKRGQGGKGSGSLSSGRMLLSRFGVGGPHFGFRSDFKDQFALGRELGRGQQGITHMCEEIKTGDRYAVKMVKKKTLTNDEAAKDLKREVAILERLAGHENIAKLYDVFEDEKCVYLVMELCEGGELFDMIIAQGTFSESSASVLVRQMLLVVGQCHQCGVVHRDLKPENFLFKSASGDGKSGASLGSSGTLIKAIDFGLSEFFLPGTVFRDIVGSAYYVAPEVLRRKYGPTADIWSIGVIMYILLTGQPPFWGPSEPDIFAAILRGKVDLKRKSLARISKHAKDIMKRMLTYDPKARITAAQALSHPWVRGEDVSDLPLDINVIKSMKDFVSYGRMKKLAIKKLSETFVDDEIPHLRDQFKNMDKDGNGTLTLDELQSSIRNMTTDPAGRQVISDDEVKSILDAMDSDGNGEIDWREFLAAALHFHQYQRKDRGGWERKTRLAFDSLDRDKDGFIDLDELRAELGDVENLRQILMEGDRDGDLKVDYEEFCHLLRVQSAK